MKLPRNAELWLLPYIQDRVRRLKVPVRPKRIWITLADHYEPVGNSRSAGEALNCVRHWQNGWQRIAADAPLDAAARPPATASSIRRKSTAVICSMACRSWSAQVLPMWRFISTMIGRRKMPSSAR